MHFFKVRCKKFQQFLLIKEVFYKNKYEIKYLGSREYKQLRTSKRILYKILSNIEPMYNEVRFK